MKPEVLEGGEKVEVCGLELCFHTSYQECKKKDKSCEKSH